MEPRRIAGHVLEAGRPAPGAEVVLEGILSSADAAYARRARAGIDGSFDFGQWPAWSYVVWAEQKGRRSLVVKLDLRNPMAAPAPDALSLELQPCAAPLRGTVRDEAGTPLPDARVRILANALNGPAVDTDAEGRYELCLGGEGKVRLRAEADGYGAAVVDLTEPPQARPQDFVLNTEAVLAGIVERFENGERLPHVQVNLWPTGSVKGRGPVTVISDQEGAFEARGLAGGSYWVNAWAQDAAGLESAVVDLRPGQVVRGFVRRLHSTSTVSARILERGVPLVGARIGLRMGKDGESFGAVTQPDGRVVIHGVFRGGNTFEVPGYRVISPHAITVGAATAPEPVLVEVEQIHGDERGRR